MHGKVSPGSAATTPVGLASAPAALSTALHEPAGLSGQHFLGPCAPVGRANAQAIGSVKRASAPDCLAGPGPKRRRRRCAILGIRLVWVAEMYRGQGVGTALLNAARHRCMLGHFVTIEEIAWGECVTDVAAFAAKYCGGKQHVRLKGRRSEQECMQ